MKSVKVLLLSIIILGAFNLLASDIVDLCGIPWTDARVSWTMNGRRLPVKNKNLMGNQISIGGVKYGKGLAGHTKFSVAYNLSKDALKFTAIIGIDDEVDPRNAKMNITESKAEIVVLVDRKEVCRKIVAWNEKGIPISINLKGASQIELQGHWAEPKYGFRRQRVVFANPEFEVVDKKRFIKNAGEWRKKVEEAIASSPNYPAAPSWKDVKIEKLRWREWENAYRIDNGVYEIVLVPEFGGKILSFNKKGGENILTENGKFPRNIMPKRGVHIPHGGHHMRPQPHNYFHHCDPILLFGKYKIEFPAEGEILMTSPKSYYLWLEYKYRIKIAKNSENIENENIQKNIAPFVMKAGIWSVTRLKSKLVKALMMPLEIENPPFAVAFHPENLHSEVKLVEAWNTLPITDALLGKLGKWGAIEWKEFPVKNELRVKLPNSTFIKKFDLPKNEIKNMGDFWPNHFYFCNLFLEVEAHGPTKTFTPSESISFKETWAIENH